MKNILIIVWLFLICSPVYAQKMPEISYNVRISEADGTIRAEINPVSSDVKARPDLRYYWYSASMIRSTQGGYSGALLNGFYSAYFLNKNLKEQGTFKKGLKNGPWKTWNEDGTLSSTAAWKNGLLVSGDSVSFWRKLNVFRKKGKPAAADPPGQTPQ